MLPQHAFQKSLIGCVEVSFAEAVPSGRNALALYPRGEPAAELKVAPVGSGFAGITLAYNTRNRRQVDALLAEAQKVGGKLLKPAQEAFWGGYSGYLSDPDGFLWEVAWNPFFQVAKDGSIQLPE